MQKLQYVKRWANRNPSLAYGAPFLIFMLTGTFALTYLTDIRYQHADSKRKTLTRGDERQLMADQRLSSMKREFEEMIQETTADSNWQ